MTILISILFIILGVYTLVFIFFSTGWRKLDSYTPSKPEKYINVSIIIPFRNEEQNIAGLLKSLKSQTYPKSHTEIIFVNDHSSDNSTNIITNFIKANRYSQLINLPESYKGKKDALALGVKKANANIILTTDADCIMNQGWLTSMVRHYTRFRATMIAGPVSYTPSLNTFHRLQHLEFLSLIGSGAGAIGLNKAIMCNGANLLFEKQFYDSCNFYNNLASGDDVFLMLHIKKELPEHIHFNKSVEAIVYTKPASSLKDFFYQRIRWASKSKKYRDMDIIFTAILVTTANLAIITSLFLSFWDHWFFKIFILLICIKSIADLTILIPATRFFKQQKLLKLFIPLQIIYPFYIIITLAFGLTGNFLWKERKIKEKR